MQDVACAVRFIHENAAKYGLDPDRICLAGQSGGAFLALGACKLLADSNEAHKVKSQFLCSPMIDNDHFDLPKDQLH